MKVYKPDLDYQNAMDLIAILKETIKEPIKEKLLSRRNTIESIIEVLEEDVEQGRTYPLRG